MGEEEEEEGRGERREKERERTGRCVRERSRTSSDSSICARARTRHSHAHALLCGKRATLSRILLLTTHKTLSHTHTQRKTRGRSPSQKTSDPLPGLPLSSYLHQETWQLVL